MNWGWFIALLVSSFILQIIEIVGLVLKYLSLAPDIIGYASSLTLMYSFIHSQVEGTTLHGLERVALLSDLKIRIGDVCSNEPVGPIAMAEMMLRELAKRIEGGYIYMKLSLFVS